MIIRPANEFKLLPSDLVFCAIPFNIPCRENDYSWETINTTQQASNAPSGINNPPTASPVGQMTTQLLSAPVPLWEQKTTAVSNSKQSILTQSGELSSRTHPGKENMKEPPAGPVPIQT